MTSPAPPAATATPAAPAASAVPLLHDMLWERFIKALEIKRRLHVMHAFTDELAGVSRNKPFRIRNDIVWNAMIDVRDKLVIDLYSLTVEMRHGIKPPMVNVSLQIRLGRFLEERSECLTADALFKCEEDISARNRALSDLEDRGNTTRLDAGHGFDLLLSA